METANIRAIKNELQYLQKEELLEICLKLAKFKKDNKELLTYLLFESGNEQRYIEGVCDYISYEFDQINHSNFYYIRKSIRKILRQVRKFNRYSAKKSTEIEILIHFTKMLTQIKPSIHNSSTLLNLYSNMMQGLRKKIQKVHEDLQYDYLTELEAIQLN